MGKISLSILITVTVGLYALLLDRTPIHLNQDELGFSLNAYSIAKTGYDENGRFLPLYFWHLGVMWATPYIVYLTAIILKLFSAIGGSTSGGPLSEFVVRLPSVIIGIIDVTLIYFLAKKIFKSEGWGLVAGLLLTITPVHFIQSRILLDNHFIIPFVLGWLLLLTYFLETKKLWLLLATGLVLGFGVHSYHAAKIMMPLYLLFTLWIIFPIVKKEIKKIFLPIIGFILPLLPLIPWLSQYPDTLVDQVKYTGLYDTKLAPFAGIASILTPENIAHRVDVFISYFNPVFLFLLGDVSLIHSTSLHHPLGLSQSVIRAGVFLLPFAVFLPFGIYHALKNEKTRFSKLIVVGFLTAPLAAAIAGDHYRISRALVMLPFATLVAVYGVKFMFSQKKRLFRTAFGEPRLWRAVCYLLLVTILLQFSYFLYDYLTGYRIRSYNWMKYNIPGALETVISEETKTSSSVIYLDNRVGFIDRYWKFYLIKHERLDLLEKTEFIDVREADFDVLIEDSILLSEFNNVDGLKTQIGKFKKITNILEPDGVSVFYVYRN